LKELDEFLNQQLDRFENKHLCYNCGSKKNTKSFMAINSEEDDDNESSVILKFCCLCYDCFHSQKIIEKVVDKLFDKENMAILDKSVGKNTQESLH